MLVLIYWDGFHHLAVGMQEKLEYVESLQHCNIWAGIIHCKYAQVVFFEAKQFHYIKASFTSVTKTVVNWEINGYANEFMFPYL